MSNKARNKRILKLAGKKSYGLIAQQLGTTRNVVAGVVFRDKYPSRHRVCSPNSTSPNKTGVGHRGNGPYAPKTRKLGAPVGNKNWMKRKWRGPKPAGVSGAEAAT